MCRFVAFIGNETIIDDILVKPSNSLISQSLHARETTFVTNGDGFGLGWYAKNISSEPAVFKAITPAWNNHNLLNLSSKVKTDCFFGHVRAATDGGVNNNNCHPFRWGNYLFMHNGGVGGFDKVKRHLRHKLDDETYEWIQGETDTEHVFALFIQNFKSIKNPTTEDVISTLKMTIEQINNLVKQYSEGAVSHLNLCITDGNKMFISRYSSNFNISPASSLYYAKGSKFKSRDGDAYMNDADYGVGCVLVCSEKLNDHTLGWHAIPENELIVVEECGEVTFYSL
jgi:glutamine amidotransferase